MGALLKSFVPRGAAAMTVVIALWAFCCAPSDALAGVIFRCDDPVPALRSLPTTTTTDAAAITDGAAAVDPDVGDGAGDEILAEKPIGCLIPLCFQKAFHSTTGGASAPPGNPGWSAGVFAASFVPSDSADPLSRGAYLQCRERSPRLPRPLVYELLDPPKTCGLPTRSDVF